METFFVPLTRKPVKSGRSNHSGRKENRSGDRRPPFRTRKRRSVRPRHALHATAIRVGGPGNEKKRKAFASHLASTLSDDRPKAVKGFVIRQLQVCGGIEQASAIANFLADPDDHIYEYAAQALEAIGPETVNHFRKTYSKAKGARA